MIALVMLACFAFASAAYWFNRRERLRDKADDLMAVADSVLIDQRHVDNRFAAIAAMEPDVAALGRIIAADLYLSEEDS